MVLKSRSVSSLYIDNRLDVGESSSCCFESEDSVVDVVRLEIGSADDSQNLVGMTS